MGIANYAFDLGGPVLLPLAVLGGHRLWRRDGHGAHDSLDRDHRAAAAANIRPITGRQTLGVLVMPAVLVLVASAIRQYPFTGSRLTLFLTPGVFLLAGFGVAALVEWSHRRRASRRWLAVAAPGYLLAVAAWHAAVYLVRPPVYGDMPAAVRYVAANDAPDDVFYANKISEFRCYWPDVPRARLRDAKELDQGVPDGRFWLVLSYRKKEKADERRVTHAGREAQQLDEFRTPGGEALLFDGIDGPATQRAATAE
jgi:hypothetical protein